VPQIEVLRILIRTSFGPGTGTGTSVRLSPGPGLNFEIARIIFALIWVQNSLSRIAAETTTNRPPRPSLGDCVRGRSPVRYRAATL